MISVEPLQIGLKGNNVIVSSLLLSSQFRLQEAVVANGCSGSGGAVGSRSGDFMSDKYHMGWVHRYPLWYYQ